MADKGNPNFATNFKGRYVVAPREGVQLSNPVIMLTITNDAQILGSFKAESFKARQTFLAEPLPEILRPAVDIHIPCVFQDSSGEWETIAVTVCADGNMFTQQNLTLPTTIFTAGVVYNTSNKYYN